ncbi:MAG: GYDIA family GHMP kinase [Bacteroidota bacterium]
MAYLAEYQANGKLLLTGEYAVLDGAQALAVPTKLGQRLEIVHHKNNLNPTLQWSSFDEQNQRWFQAEFSLPKLQILATSDELVSQRLLQLFQVIRLRHPSFLTGSLSLQANIYLEFPRNWGLGSSSTLVYLLAQWAEVDPFPLQFEVFSGSGYDIACAGTQQPIFYQRVQEKPLVQEVEFAPDFLDQLYFVYLGQKQDSRKGIAQYRKNAKQQARLVKTITSLTHDFLAAKDLKTLEKVIEEHEAIVAESIAMETAKATRFQDYWGAVKSLGAWGGDFILATSDRSREEVSTYFRNKNYQTIFRYKDLIIN